MLHPPTPAAERFATLIRCIGQSVASQTGWGLPLQVIAAIINRLRGINQRFARLAARIAAGSYVPRRPPATPRKQAPRPPRPPGLLSQKRGWLLPLEPQAVVYAGQLETLFRDPEMVALMQAAPEALRRPIRSLCRMLRVTPPDILALPAKPRPPRKIRPPKAPPPPPRPPLQTPSWWVEPPMRIRTRWSFGRTRIPPGPA